MKRIILTAGIAVLAAIPATLGLIGNASFGESVPISIPAGATLLDDRSSQTSTTTPEGRRRIYSPHAWRHIEDQSSHRREVKSRIVV